MERLLVTSTFEKVNEQVDRIRHLIELASALPVDWTPPLAGALPIGWLFAHLAECLAGFGAVLLAVKPAELAYLEEWKRAPLGAVATAREALERLGQWSDLVKDASAVLNDGHLARRIPTIFAPEGHTVLLLLLGNLEHLISHKCQLFSYLKMAGVAVESRDLYRFR